MDSSASFGYWVRRRRRALDLTQAALAQVVGCAAVTIKKIENDERRPSRGMAERLAQFLHVPPAEHDHFLACALGELSTLRLALTTAPVEAARPPEELPMGDASPEASSGAGFVGRANELQQLEAQLARALGGDGRVVLVAGEAGQGKTALLRELARRAQAAHGALLVLCGTCNAYAAVGDPYLPFRDVLAMLTGDTAPQPAGGMATHENSRRLEQLLPAAVEELLLHGPELLEHFVSGAAVLRRAAPAAGDRPWLGKLRLLATRSVPAPDAGERPPLIEQYTRVLCAVAAHSPLLVLLDDLQWADAASINLLFHFGRRLRGARILVVGAFRPSDLDTHGAAHPLQAARDELVRLFGDVEVDLDSISAACARRFVDAVLDAEPNQLDERFRERLFGHTHGHPLFTLELLGELRARGALARDAKQRWVEQPTLDWDVLPTRVEAVIRQRLSRIEPELRELLNAASVEGESFGAATVAAVLGCDEQRVLRLLRWELQQRHRLVREREEGEAGGRRLQRYQFSHVLFQHYLYAELGRGERRLLHGAVARALEALYGSHAEQIAGRLARHYQAAGEDARAVDYMLQAGDQARTLYASQEAGECYRRALALLEQQGDDERAARTLVKLGLTYQSAFDFERARRAYDRGFALWQQIGGLRPVRPQLRAPHALRVDWRDPPTLDPARAGNFWSAGVIGQLFSGLVELTPESDVVPDVARSWEVLDGGRRYVFHLRDDVCWTDGRPVTAGDFAFAWTRALRGPNAALAGLLLADIKGAAELRANRGAKLAGVSATAADRLEVRLEQPVAAFPHLLAHPATYPVPRHVVEAIGERWAEPGTIVSNGPFTLEAWRPREQLVLARNPDYAGRFTGNLECVVLHLTAEPFDKLALYEHDDLDVFRAWFLPAPALMRARQHYAEDYRSGPQVTTLYVGFDSSRPPFDDGRVRRALALAIDRDAYAARVHRGHYAPANGGLVPPGMPGHAPAIGLPFDPAGARQLLAEAGFLHGSAFPDIELLVSAFRAHEAAHLIARWREQLGIAVRVRSIEAALSGEVLRAERPLLFYNGWAADYADPDSFLRVCIRATLPDWHNAAFERLVAQARRATDQPARVELHRRADRMLVEEAVLVPVSYTRVQLLVKPWVGRFPISAMKAWFLKDVVLEPH